MPSASVTRGSARLLALLQLFAAVASVVQAAWPFVADEDQNARLALALAWVLLAVATLVVVPRRPIWVLELLLSLSAVAVAVGIALAETAQGQLVQSVVLFLLGAYAANALSRSRLSAWVAASAALALLAFFAPRSMTEFWVPVVVVGAFAVNTVMVGRLGDRIRVTASTDPLTGALNRRGVEEQAPALQAMALRAGEPTHVVVVDCDRFKAVNDRHGHAAGDALLVDLVRGWRLDLRPSDLVARVGGDEFLLVFPRADERAVDASITRLRRHAPTPWTAGWVEWREDEDLFDAAARADERMYAAKHPIDLREPPVGAPVDADADGTGRGAPETD